MQEGHQLFHCISQQTHLFHQEEYRVVLHKYLSSPSNHYQYLLFGYKDRGSIPLLSRCLGHYQYLGNKNSLVSLRSVVVEQVQVAACTVGFVQIVNHGVPLSLMDDVVMAIKAGLGPEEAGSCYVPEGCRTAVVEWDEATKKLGEVLLGLMSEGFGLKREALEQKLCMEAKIMTGNHYPYCPQPDLTVGLKPRTEPVLFTLLLPDQIPGLQVEIEEHEWINLVAHPGTLVLNVGEVLQIISNGQYISAEHRVLAESFEEPGILVAVFSNPSKTAEPYGPLPELESPDEAAHYHDFDLFELKQQIKREEGAESSINNHSIDQNSKWNWNPLGI